MKILRQTGARELCCTGDSFYDNVSSSDNCTRQVPGSNTNINRDREYFEDLRSFPQSIQANSE
jgi:hypothetical protein